MPRKFPEVMISGTRRDKDGRCRPTCTASNRVASRKRERAFPRNWTPFGFFRSPFIGQTRFRINVPPQLPRCPAACIRI